MINVKELKLELANNFGNTGLIKIEYFNKPDFAGYIHRMNEDDLEFTLMHHVSEVGSEKYCELDFQDLKKIIIKYNDSSLIKVFE